MMKHLGAPTMPGVPDFNQSTIAMGQHLLNPPSVAGWAGGKTWITPGLLIARGNVARDVLIPDMTGFRDWNFNAGTDDVLGQRLRDGYDIGAATAVNDPANMIDVRPRGARARREVQHADLRLHRLGASGAEPDPDAARRRAFRPRRDGVGRRRDDDRGSRRLSRRADAARAGGQARRATRWSQFLTKELGTDSLDRAKTYMEDALRMTAHLRDEHARVSDRLAVRSPRQVADFAVTGWRPSRRCCPMRFGFRVGRPTRSTE